MEGAPNLRPRRRGAIPSGLALLLPVLAIAGLEVGLRGIGFGSGYPLFVEASGMPGYRQANPDLIWRYYDRAPDLGIDPMPFRATRGAGGHRIVVQGGSTAAGFPFGRWAGLAGMLGDRLAATFPDREIEVVSTAMSAVNSNTLRNLVDEIIAIEPDAVLMYAGHNEFVGILGAASSMTPTHNPPLARAYVGLRRLRLYQLARWLVTSARSGLAMLGAGAAPDRTSLFAAAAAGALVPLDSPSYRRGAAQFSTNLEYLLVRYREAGIPVFVGTLVSNEADQPPFASSVSEVDGESRDELWRRYGEAREAGDPTLAREVLRELLDAADGDADAWYALGQIERAAGDPAAARTAFRKAKDRDQLRFRAPEAFNAEIRELAARHGATLVDVQQRFAQASPGGIVGRELMLEHLHPNAEGYFLLADAFYDALRSAGAIAASNGAPSREQAWRDMPLIAFDRIRGNRIVAELKSGYPFSGESGGGAPAPASAPASATVEARLEEQIERGEVTQLEAMDALLQHYRDTGRMADARVVARVAAESYPTDGAPNFVAGRLYLDAGEHHRARRYLMRSLAANPEDPATLRALVRVEHRLGNEAAVAVHEARLLGLAASSDGAANDQ